MCVSIRVSCGTSVQLGHLHVLLVISVTETGPRPSTLLAQTHRVTASKLLPKQTLSHCYLHRGAIPEANSMMCELLSTKRGYVDDPIKQILCFKCDLRILNEKYVNNHAVGDFKQCNDICIFSR